MLIDTHAHINTMLNPTFDIPLTPQLVDEAKSIINESLSHTVQIIINVGTNIIESKNSIALAQQYPEIFATIGIHPNDCTDSWRSDITELIRLLQTKKENKIVAIGECGLDMHYPDYNLSRQQDAFRAQIDLALEHDLALVIHSRDAYDETLKMLDEYKNDIMRLVMHCFSYDQAFADYVAAQGWLLGIGGIISYPKNTELQKIIRQIDVKHVVLETDAPFLPMQSMRGKKNHPQYIALIANYIAQLRSEPVEVIAKQTTENARTLFALSRYK